MPIQFTDDQTLEALLTITVEDNCWLEEEIAEIFGEQFVRHGVYTVVLDYQRAKRILLNIYDQAKECAWVRQQGIPDNEAAIAKRQAVVDCLADKLL